MSLQKAYLTVEEAERFFGNGNFLESSNLQKKAAEEFQAVLNDVQKDDTTDLKIIEALELLVTQHQKRAIQLKYHARLKEITEKKAREASKKQKNSDSVAEKSGSINGNDQVIGSNFYNATRNTNIIDSLANKRSQRVDLRNVIKSNASGNNSSNTSNFMGEYSIINGNGSSLMTALNGNNGCKQGNDTSHIQLAILNLFETLKIDPMIDTLADDRVEGKTTLTHYETNYSILNSKTKEELVLENQQLKSNLVHLNKLIDRLNLKTHSSNDKKHLVLIDKLKFEKGLNNVISTSSKYNNANIGIGKFNGSFGTNPAKLFSQFNGAFDLGTPRNTNSGNNNNNKTNSSSSSNIDSSALSSKLISEKEAEISKLQQLLRNQERQVQRLTKEFKLFNRKKNSLVEDYHKLKQENLMLQQKLDIPPQRRVDYNKANVTYTLPVLGEQRRTETLDQRANRNIINEVRISGISGSANAYRRSSIIQSDDDEDDDEDSDNDLDDDDDDDDSSSEIEGIDIVAGEK